MVKLQKSSVLETVKSRPAGILAWIPYDEVIDQFYIHYPGGFPKPPRYLNIRGTRSWITAGMVVKYDDGRCAQSYRFFEYFARMNKTAVCRARGNFDFAYKPVLSIQAQRPEFFHRQAGCDGQGKIKHGFWAVQQWRFALFASDDPPCYFQDRHEL